MDLSRRENSWADAMTVLDGIVQADEVIAWCPECQADRLFGWLPDSDEFGDEDWAMVCLACGTWQDADHHPA